MMDVKFTTLLTLLDSGNYTRTAEKLALTQPAVSHHIRQLEEEYKIQIFHRNKRELKLTPEGEILVKFARRIEGMYQNVRVAIEDERSRITRINIAITPTANENMVPQLLAQYCHTHPNTHVNICVDSLENIKEKMKFFEVDLAFVDGQIKDDKFTSVLLDIDRMCLITAMNHPFADKQSVSLSELKTQNFILRTRSAGSRLLFERYLQENLENIHNFNVVIETEQISIIRTLVKKGLGVSIMSYKLCEKDIRHHHLAAVSIENSMMEREINMVYPKDFTHTEILGELKNLYQQLNAQNYRS